MSTFSKIQYMYDAALMDSSWANVLDHVSDAVNSKGVLLFSNNTIGLPYDTRQSSSFWAEKEELMQDYHSKFGHAEDEAQRLLLSQPAYSLLTDSEMSLAISEITGNEIITFLQERCGVLRRVMVNLSASKEQQAGVAFQFSMTDENLPDLLEENASILMPHLAKALSINSFFAALREQYNAVLSVLDCMSVGLAVISPLGQVVVSNQKFDEVLFQTDALYVSRNKQLRFKDEDTDRSCRNFIGEIAATASGSNTISEFITSIPRQSDSEPLLFEISPLKDFVGELDVKFSGGLVILIDPENPPSISIASFGTYFGLTKRESEVAEGLAHGLSLVQISETQSVSLDTIKTQCKSIYSKTDVVNRAQLIRKLVALSPPIVAKKQD